jgi:hypothetical protein
MKVNLPGWTRIPKVIIIIPVGINPMHKRFAMVSSIFTPVRVLMPVTYIFLGMTMVMVVDTSARSVIMVMSLA